MVFNLFRWISRVSCISRAKHPYYSTLLCIEHQLGHICVSSNHALTASLKIGSVVCLVAGEDDMQVNLVAETVSKFSGISKVLIATHTLYQHPLVEPLTDLIVSLQKTHGFTHISMPASSFGKSLIPRLAGKLNVAPISEIIDVLSEKTFIRTMYASNAIATVTSNDPIRLFTVRSTAFSPTICQQNSAQIERIQYQNQIFVSKWLRQSLTSSERPELSNAKIVISGGRGLKSGDNFDMLYKLADKMGAAVGASRAAVDAGFVPNELQIGQTGKIVAPQLYIAVGISGAIQHLAGMKDSKTIVAINKDPDAPIFQVADYGLVADLFKVIPELDTMF